MGTTEPLVLTLEVTPTGEDTIISNQTTAILVGMEVMAALFPMERNILPTRQSMMDMEHQVAINTEVSIDRSTPSVVTTLQVLTRAIPSIEVDKMVQVIMEETISKVAARTTAADMEAMKVVMASMEEIIMAAIELLEGTV